MKVALKIKTEERRTEEFDVEFPLYIEANYYGSDTSDWIHFHKFDIDPARPNILIEWEITRKEDFRARHGQYAWEIEYDEKNLKDDLGYYLTQSYCERITEEKWNSIVSELHQTVFKLAPPQSDEDISSAT